MKKLLKSFLIATASIGIIAGSTTIVVSCSNNENQKKYDTALEKFRATIADGTALTSIHIVINSKSNPTEMANLKLRIEERMNKFINIDKDTKDILGTVSVDLSKMNFDDSTATDVQKTATGLTFTATSDLSGVTQAPPAPFSLLYTVVDSHQGEYDKAVEDIMKSINVQAEKDNVFGTTDTELTVGTYIYNLINDAIPVNSATIAKFTATTELPDLTSEALRIKSTIDKGASTGNQQLVDQITFKAKLGNVITYTVQFMLNYSVK